MKRKFVHLVIFTLMLSVVGTVSAQTSPTPTAEATTTASPTATPTSEVSSTPTVSPTVSPTVPHNPSTFQIKTTAPITWLRFRRLITFNPQKKSELTLAISNALLEKAKAEQAAGNTEKAETIVEQFAKEMDYLETVVITIQERQTDSTFSESLDTILADKTAQLTLLESMAPNAAGTLATKLANVRAKALEKIVKVLNNPELTDEEKQTKVSEVIAKYAEKEAKIDEKITKRLALIDELTDQSDDLVPHLETEEDKIIGESEALDAISLAAITTFFQNRSDDRGLLVLQKLLDKVPAAAKPALETAIANMVSKKTTEFANNPAALEVFLDKQGNSEAREALVNRFKTTNPTIKKEIEKKELTKPSNSGSGSRSGTSTTPAPRPTSTITTTASPQVEKQDIEIRVKDGKFVVPTMTIRKGRRLTIRFRNDDPISRTLTLSDGRTSTPVQGNQTILETFVVTDSLTFTATNVTGTGSLTAQ